MKHSAASPTVIRQRAAALGEPRPIRRGSLSERFIKCGKAACPCHKSPEARHGPYFSLTRQVDGRTRSRYLSSEQAARARDQIRAGREFRDAVGLHWEGCEQLADEELASLSAAEVSEPEKGGSARRSRRRPRKK
jgi:hypothetical protein